MTSVLPIQTPYNRFLNEEHSVRKARKGLENIKKGFCSVYMIAETGPKPSPIPPISTRQDGRDCGVYCGIFQQYLPHFWDRKSMVMLPVCVHVHRGNESLRTVRTRESVCGSEGWISVVWGALGTGFLFSSLRKAEARAWLAEVDQHQGQREKSEHWSC